MAAQNGDSIAKTEAVPDALEGIVKELGEVHKEKEEFITKQENDDMSSEDWEAWDILCGWERGLQFAENLLRKQQGESEVLYLTPDGAIHFDPTKPELMKELIMHGVEVQMPIKPLNSNQQATGGDPGMMQPKHIRVRRFLSGEKIGDRFLAEEVAKGANLRSRTQAGNILKWQPEVRKRVIAPGSPLCEWELIAEVPI